MLAAIFNEGRNYLVSTMNRQHQLKEFFTAYAKRFNDYLFSGHLDIEGTVNSFAPFFVESSPVGITGGSNDKNFKEAIGKGYSFYKSIGTKSMDIRNSEITLLDDYHAMARIQWTARYEKGVQNTSIDFDVIYLVQTLNGQTKIFAYITGDEQKVMQEAGII